MSNRFFQRAVRGLMRAVCTAAVAATPFAIPGTAHAFTLEQHRALVDKFINERHADPLVADCAAHASFVVATLPGYESVEYNDTALDPTHAKVEPWSGPFDDRKQRVDVTQMVTLDGVGKRTTGQTDEIHIRCGYADGRMMGFDYTSPLPQVETPVRRASKSSKAHGKSSHVASKSGAKRSTTRSTANKSTASKSTAKKAAPKKKAN